MSQPTAVDSEPVLREKLFTVGRDLLKKSPGAPELPQLLEEYTDTFSRWYGATNVGVSGLDGLSIVGDPVAVLESVQALHDAVLRRAGEAQELAATELKTVKSKGKGILAYVDTLPKRVSLNKARKG